MNHCTLFTYQTNQTVSIKYKVVLLCLRIAYQGVHAPYLQGENYHDDSTFGGKFNSSSWTEKNRITENVNK